MPEEPWNKHIPGDPMPCKCGDSVVEVHLRNGYRCIINSATQWKWGKLWLAPDTEITAWRFVERKGEDVIPADPYDALEWDEDGTATVALKVPGRPEWVRDDDEIKFRRNQEFMPAPLWASSWDNGIAFQIKRRPALTPAVSQVLAMLDAADDAEAAAIRRAARRANIEVPE